jgi:hypothetical protein
MNALPELALSINQPWAWLIAAGHKDVENRNWKTDFRGEFLIHAGMKIDKCCADDIAEGIHPVTGFGRDFGAPAPYQRGGIVGIAELYRVVTLNSGGRGNPWFVGRYGFLLRNARPIEFIPCVGALGFFRPDFSRTYVEKPPTKPKASKPAPPPALPADPAADLFADG